MRRILSGIVIAAVLFTGCGQRQKKAQAGTEAGQKQEVKPTTFPRADVPMYINTDEEFVDYLVAHYWDNFDFSDTRYVGTDALEKAYGEYATLLLMSPDMQASRKSMADMMAAAGKHPEMYDYLWDMADKYLYDPNSPVRDDELYMVVLESVLANPDIDEVMKIVPRERLAVAGMNRVGEKANDFTYMTSGGKEGTLYGIRADYTLVFFYNLGCNACKEVREGMLMVLRETELGDMARAGKLKILAMYPDTQMEDWDKYLGDIPADWINAYDPTGDNALKDLYDLKAIPSLYLLDKDKKVMVKDFIEPERLYYTILSDMSAGL